LEQDLEQIKSNFKKLELAASIGLLIVVWEDAFEVAIVHITLIAETVGVAGAFSCYCISMVGNNV
jgi:hypothetical protein